MALRKPVFINVDGNDVGPKEMDPDNDSLQLQGMTIASGGAGITMNSTKITGMAAATASGDALAYGQSGGALAGLSLTGALAMGGSKITNLGDPSDPGDVVNKQTLDQAILSGGSIKEALFAVDQLNDTDGINALEALYFANQPSVGDTVILTDGTTTRTYDFVANQGAESAATDVSIESDAATAMARLVTRVNADAGNTVWDLSTSANHSDINATIVMVIEKASAAGDSTSRIYGTWTTQADFQVVPFQDGTGVIKYTTEVPETASTTDPAAGRFGLRRTVANLTDGEIHFMLDIDAQYAWDGDDTTWNQLSGTGSIPDATAASGGGVKGKVTFDSDKGLDVVNGVAEIDLLATGGLEFSGGDIAAKLEASKGLASSAAGLAVVPDTNQGLDVGASGVFVDLGTDPGLEFVGGDLEAKVNGTTGAMLKDADGLGVKIESSKGLAIGGAGLAAVPDTNQGLDVGATGLFVDLATNPGLQFNAGDLEALVNTAAGMDKDASGLKVKADGAAGIEITGDGVAVDLAASNPGMQFDGSGDLQVLADGTRGQGVDGSGLFVKLLAAGGIQFDGSGNLEIKLDETPDTLDVDASGLKVVGLPSLFKVNDVATSANVSAGNLDALTGGGSTTLHTHPEIAESGKLENDIAVDESIAAADPVYITATGDRVGKSDAADNAKAEVMGVARTAQSTVGQVSSVVHHGRAASILAGATPGTRYYLQTGGGIGASAPSGPGNRNIVRVGWAMTATDLWVDVRPIGRGI